MPFASAPSICIAETVKDQRRLYERLHLPSFPLGPDFIGYAALDYIEHLSAGDLRGTNLRNMADRHNATMLEA